MKDGFDFLTVVVDENGIESEVYVDRGNGRVYVSHTAGYHKVSSIDVYGQVRNHDNNEFNATLKGSEND